MKKLLLGTACVAVVFGWMAWSEHMLPMEPVVRSAGAETDFRPRNSVGEYAAMQERKRPVVADADHLGTNEIQSVMESALRGVDVGWGSAIYDRCAEVYDLLKTGPGGVYGGALFGVYGGAYDRALIAKVRVRLAACKAEIDKANAAYLAVPVCQREACKPK